MTDKARLDALSTMVADRLRELPARPKFRIVTPADFDVGASKSLTAIDRAWHLDRIADLKRMYSLDWLVRQETRRAGSVVGLDDDSLRALLDLMETARECIRDDVPFEDRGLIHRA
ncbi:hypothetical protein [Lysobacter capsici]|uniref:hypothetical protein n=1 Tax=Lysobacter capsici TaxID=435897 RepID=UPI001C001821|nr:hypothetical protein [Lysobacter capsici]QWF19272.1 hypothetical protein KME82_11295 [Lysobacter capsici]